MCSAFTSCIYVYNVQVLPTYLQWTSRSDRDEFPDFYIFWSAIDSQYTNWTMIWKNLRWKWKVQGVMYISVYAKQVPYSFILLLPYRIRYLLMYMYQNIPKQTTADIIACLWTTDHQLQTVPWLFTCKKWRLFIRFPIDPEGCFNKNKIGNKKLQSLTKVNIMKNFKRIFSMYSFAL